MDLLLRVSDFRATLINGFRSCALVPFGPEYFDFSSKLLKSAKLCNFVSLPAVTEGNVSHLEYLEHRIPRSILAEFKKFRSENDGNELWNGLEFYGGLYETWNTFKKDEHVQSIGNSQENRVSDREVQSDWANNRENIVTDEEFQTFDRIPFLHELSNETAEPPINDAELFLIEVKFDSNVTSLLNKISHSSKSTETSCLNFGLSATSTGIPDQLTKIPQASTSMF